LTCLLMGDSIYER